MASVRFERAWLVVIASILAAGAGPAVSASRADCERDYSPQSGQSGKDVIWVPTNDGLVKRMLDMAGTKASDRVFDLGAGDGKIAISAAKHFGATAVGVEYNPDMAKLAQCYAEAEGVSDRVRIVNGDIFETDFSQATVVTLYLLPELNLRLRPTLLKMKPGTRVVSHSFLMGDWEPDERSTTEDGSAYLWIVPAQVEGRWTFRKQGGGGSSKNDSFTLELKQKYQRIEGTADGEAGQPIAAGKLDGSQLELAFDDGAPVKVTGSVQNDRIDAVVKRGSTSTKYVASRS